jgi:hypothetical protein
LKHILQTISKKNKTGILGIRRVAAKRVSRCSLKACFRCPSSRFPSASAVRRFLSSITASEGPETPEDDEELNPLDKERDFDATPDETPRTCMAGPNPSIAIPSSTIMAPATTRPPRSNRSTGSVRKFPSCDDDAEVAALQTIHPRGLDVNDGQPLAEVSDAIPPGADLPLLPLLPPVPPPGFAGTFPLRYWRYAPLVYVPQAESP